MKEGEGAARVKVGHPQTVSRVVGEIDGLRGDLGALVSELDRRRHELFDVRLQVRRHPAVLIGAAGVAALILGGLVALSVRSRRHERRPAIRVRDARRALARLLDHPRRVAAEPRVGTKVLAAVGAAAGSVLARRGLELLLARTRTPPAPAPDARTPAHRDELGLRRP